MKAAKNLVFQENSPEYIIKLKRRNYWWLLLFLLLLLPLLLLIHIEKQVDIKFVDAAQKNPIASADAVMAYPEYEMFDFSDHSFFSKKNIRKTGKTNKEGLVSYTVRYSLYSRLFHSNMDANFKIQSECFGGDSIEQRFFSLKHKQLTVLEVPPRALPVTFIVVDADDNQPLPKATIEINILPDSQKPMFTDSSDVSGSATFKKIPYCAEILVIGKCEGYWNDTMRTQVKFVYDRNDSTRTLRLKPVKKMVAFHVKNLKSKEPVAGATATLKIKNKTITIRTNTNGVGKGAFDEVVVVAEMTLMVQKSFFYDTLKIDKVANFIAQNDEYRTLYMRPRMQNISFRNIDETTGAPVAGVMNVIIVNNRPLPEAVYSNGNGEFLIAGVFAEDKISITATKESYQTNDYTIQNKNFGLLLDGNQSDRNIPMKYIAPPPPPPPIQDDSGLQGKSGDLRINLQWNTTDDLDLYITDPCNNVIFYRKRTKTCNGGTGVLDVDANVTRLTNTPQENTYWNTPSKGNYIITVKFFKRNLKNGAPVDFNITVIDKGVRKDFPAQVQNAGQELMVKIYEVQ